MTEDLYKYIIGLSGVLIGLLIGIIAYFLRIVHADAEKAIDDCGKNKSNIELLQLQLNSDVKRIEQTTQLELRNLADTVGKLSKSVERLVNLKLNEE